MREESEYPGQDDREQNHFCPNLFQALGVSYQKWVHRATLHDPNKYGIKKKITVLMLSMYCEEKVQMSKYFRISTQMFAV